MKRWVVAAPFVIALAAAAQMAFVQGPSRRGSAAGVAFPRIDPARLLEHVKVLSSDDFAGRLPGTPGEERTVSYIADQFRQVGVQPGAADGTYFQKVPMVGMTPSPSMTLTLGRGTDTRRLAYLEDFVAWTRRQVEDVSLQDSPLVFVGYGVQAPEYDWDDYKGVDVRGKTVVMLINDPPVRSPKDPSKLDPAVFGGDAMTYYGRWTYKYDIAAEKGAAGVLIVHETAPAGYPWSVVKSFGGERFDLVTPGGNADKAIVEGWITLERARELFAMAGQKFDVLHREAATRAFWPVALDVTASARFSNRLCRVESRNVLARFEGADPTLRDECVVFTAHWDHFGTKSDGVYHGAADNGSGVAGLIEMARAYAQPSARPKRSLVFVSVTGEEQGLLGSSYYVQHPVIPLSRTLADINIDMLNVHGRTKDVTLVGMGKSELDEYARRAAARQQRVVHADLDPSKGYFYRSDHFPFAKEGVPGLYVDWVRNRYVGKPASYGRRVAEQYTANRYHKPSDVITPDWDLAGAVEDLQLLWMVGYDVAQADQFPQWNPASEFRRK